MELKLTSDASGEYYVAITDHGDLKVLLSKDEGCSRFYRVTEWRKSRKRYLFIVPSGYGQTETAYLFKDIAETVDAFRKYNPVVKVSLPGIDLDMNGKVYASWLALSATFFTGVIAGMLSFWMLVS